MKESVRLSIPTPCMEDWDKMLPAEQGRHCESCCKTVVDFTTMTDEEVFDYFKALARRDAEEVKGRVCGRFMAGQLGRELAPAPVQRNGWSGWKWMVAGSMVFSQPRVGGRPAPPLVGADARGPMNARSMSVRDTTGPAAQHVLLGDTTVPVFTGDIEIKPVERPDSVLENAVMGKPPVAWVDGRANAVTKGEISRDTEEDSIADLPAVVVTALPPIICRHVGIMSGAVVVVRDTDIRKIPADTPSLLKKVVDTTVQMLKDTAAAILPALRSDNELVVYPNPVVRDGQLRLAWSGEAGMRQLMLVSAAGMLVQERMIDVAAKGQVDEWVLPQGLAAGIYFIRVMRPGKAAQTTELLVQ